VADQKITQLNPLLAADTQATVDVLPIADVSTAETKKITVAAVVTAGVGAIADNTIAGAKLQDGSITATQIAENAIGSSELADNAVDTAAIANLAVTAAKIANDTITAAQIAPSAIGASELADDAVDSAAIASAAVIEAKIATGAVTNTKLGDGAVTNAKIADGTIADTKLNLADGSINGAKLVSASVTATQLASNAATTAKIADGAITTAKLATGAVTATQIAADTITAAQIAADAVGSSELADNAVDTAAIQDLAVTTAKIADDAVTAAKIAAGAIGSSEIADGSVGASELASDAVTTAKITNGAVTTAKFAASAVDATALASNAVTTAKILDGNVTAAKLANDLDGSEFLAQSANTVLAGPAAGGSAVPSFRALTATDIPLLTGTQLPIATTSVRGTISVGTGLSADGAGVLSISNTVTGATATKITYNSSGLVTGSSNLAAADIPALDTSKITTGTFGASLIGTGAITAPKLADQSTVLFGGAIDTGGNVVFPPASFKGQYFYDEINQDLYIWSGSAWLPVTIISGELIYAGTYNASINQVASVTTAGAAVGLSAGVALPAASSTNNRYYLVVSDSGTGSGNAPAEALAPPDMILSNGTSWDLIDVSSAIGSQIATNVSFSPAGNVIATNVQLAIQELDTEKVAKAGDTMTGSLTLNNANLIFEGSTADDYETTLTVVDPTADRTITLPNQSGNVLVSGNASIVNADISASAEIAVSKLANGTARQLLQTASGGTDVEWASNIDIPGTLDVTGVATFDTTVAIGAGNLNYSDGTY
jgi:hypothetical protein